MPKKPAEPTHDDQHGPPAPVGAAPMQAHAAAAGVSLEDVKEGLKRLMPLLETAARLTPNKYDDAAVVFLKSLLAA